MSDSKKQWPVSRPFVGGIGFFSILLFAVLAAAQPSNHDESVLADSGKIRVESAIVKLIDSVKVPAELAGVLSELEYREGQMVIKGEKIAKINNDELVLRLKRAEIEDRIAQSTAGNDIDVRFAKKSLEVSSSKVTRSVSSNQRVAGVVPSGRIQEQKLVEHRDRLRVEQASRELTVAAMQVELAANDVQIARLSLDKSTIRAPIDGMIVVIERKTGEWVKPGDTIVRVVRMDRLKIEGFVPASLASQIRIGDPAIAVINQRWLKEDEFVGKVLFINPEANPVNSKVQIWVEVENHDLKLIPGLESTLTIDTARQ